MLPIQITLEGFMSYRERATLSFEGAPLWMLSGNNGAGKSTVFDAMRWTLFGRHRGGAQGQEALIHHGAPRLRVAFDLGLGDERFRLIRTLSRAGRSTWQIEKLGEDGVEKVPETDMRDGYEKWLREHIGLSDETFCAAMYLAQGRGDAILSARPEERHEMLAEIVDLSAFEALHERAKTRASALESAARVAKTQWELAPGADAEEIAQLRENLAASDAEIAQNAARRDELTTLLPWAAQWETLQNERNETQNALESARQLLGDGPQIERDFARLRELETLLPPLERLFQNRERAAENAIQNAAARADLARENENHDAATRVLEAAQEKTAQLESARREHEKSQLEALARLGEIAPRLAAARQWETWRGEIAALETEIGAFSADLEARRADLEAKIEDAQQNLVAAGIGARFAREKAAWQSARRDENAAQMRLLEIENELPSAQTALENAQIAFQNAQDAQTRAVEILAAAQTRLDDARAAKARFAEVEGEANCYFCGQKLTEKHAIAEGNRLEIALQTAQNELKIARQSRSQTETAAREFQSALGAAQTARRELETEAQNLETAQKSARKTREAAFQGAAQTLRELSPPFAARFDGIAAVFDDDARVLAALESDADALQTPQSEAGELENWRRELERATRDLAQKNEIQARLFDRQNQIAPLETQFSPVILAELRGAESELREILEAATTQIGASEKQGEKARREVENASGALETARRKIARLEALLAGFRSAQTEIERALEREIDTAPDVLRPFLAREIEDFASVLEAARREKSALEKGDLPARFEALREGQNRVAQLESEAARLEKAAQVVPEAARREKSALETEIAARRGEIARGEAQKRELEPQIGQMQRDFESKQRLETALLEGQNLARQHKTLADLLGPHQLQRFLLREAENGIVDEANAVLDRISSGTLRLEIRADDDEIAGARKGAPKVLDVAVFRADDGGNGQGMLPAFLSGSQRFRVAVSLALGIGRYATRGGGNRLESVIIDEGFGSLDKIGRGEMIDELKALGDELKRVILVSHQEEFADAFPNRYLITKENGTSTARLVGC